MRKLADVLKNKRFIGLVLLTIVIIIGIVLTVFLVNKNSTVEKLDIKEVGYSNNYSFCVSDIKTMPVDDYVELSVHIVIDAKKTIKVSEDDFKVNGINPKSSENFKEKISSEKVEFVLKYDIKTNELLYLTFESFKVALASVM